MPQVKKLRKCETDRFDYSWEKDGNPFPIQVYKGGGFYGFCPGKATWFDYLVRVYNVLTLCCELNKLPYEGSIFNQPDWVIEHLSWFARKYNHLSQLTRSGMITLEKNPKPKTSSSIEGTTYGTGQRPSFSNKGR